MKITTEIINILVESKIIGNKLYLPDIQLDRKIYILVNKVLVSIGGKWNKKEKAHLFDKNIDGILEEIILTGEYVNIKKEYQFFETPKHIVKQLIELADMQEGETVLEPSAGRGSIALLVRRCYCIELNFENYMYLKTKNLYAINCDFLKTHEKYDVIIANPPFSKQQDIDHINHMINLAKRRVVSIASASVMWRTNKKTVEFRERIKNLGGTITILPEGSFKESGTNVSTCIICVNL